MPSYSRMPCMSWCTVPVLRIKTPLFCSKLSSRCIYAAYTLHMHIRRARLYACGVYMDMDMDICARVGHPRKRFGALDSAALARLAVERARRAEPAAEESEAEDGTEREVDGGKRS